MANKKRKQLTNLGRFIVHMLVDRDETEKEMAEKLGMVRNSISSILRGTGYLSARFMALPEVYNFSEENRKTFATLCQEHNEHRQRINIKLGKVSYLKRPNVVTLVKLLKQNAYFFSEATLHACLSCLQRDLEKNLVEGIVNENAVCED